MQFSCQVDVLDQNNTVITIDIFIVVVIYQLHAQNLVL